jgi:acyl-CoA reductase-like NAD-dependent aldehyde dehydrogenase
MTLAVQRYPLLVGGEELSGADGATFIIANPASGEELAVVDRAGPADVDRAVAAARAAFDGGTWARTTAAKRSRLLNKLADLIEQEADDLARLEAANVGKPFQEARTDVQVAIDNFRYYAGLAFTVGGETPPVSGPFFGYTIRQPVGVCALIVPWNFPLMLTSWKVAPALACGNTVIIKPASATPLTAVRLGQLARDAGFPPGVVNVLPGPGGQIGMALVRHPGVDKIAFTGSTEVGRAVMTEAATSIKRVTLELGGKSPALVFADAKLDLAVAGCLASIFRNCGQMCTARSRILVERTIYAEFVERFGAAAAKIRIGDPLAKGTQMGPLVSNAQRDAVHGYVEQGQQEGARLIAGGQRPEGEQYARGSFYTPTVFADVAPEMAIFQEEIFGPVAAIAPFTDEDDAVRLANATIYGLAATIWTNDVARTHRLAQRIKSGNIWVNTWVDGLVEAPFGGFKQSGLGREQGTEVLNHYTEVKSVAINLTEKLIDFYGIGSE